MDVFEHDARLIARFAIPAVLTNLATPAGGAYVTMAMSHFSDSAVAGWAVLGRIIPIAFGTIFSLSGSIGAIIGQNLGARKFDRVRAALNGGLTFAAAFSMFAWLVLAIVAPALVQLFNATGEAARLILFFCRWLAPLFAFFGTLYRVQCRLQHARASALRHGAGLGTRHARHGAVRHARRALGRRGRAGGPYGRRASPSGLPRWSWSAP